MKKGRGLAIFLFVCLFSLFILSFFDFVSAQVIINEVMPNPIDDCNDCTEWLEIYSDSPINVSLWIIDSGGRNTTLDFFLEDYLVVTKNKTKFLELWDIDDYKVVEGKTSLNNDGDLILVYDENEMIVDELNYPEIEQNESYSFFDSWQICIPTPGQENYCEEEPEPECYVDSDCDDDNELTIDYCENGFCFNELEEEQEEEEEENEQESYISIVDAPEEATFGDIIDVKIKVYRGDTRKYAVYIRIENKNEKEVSEEVSLHVLTKYIEYSFKVPVQLDLNCDEKNEDDDYTIVVEGLDEKTSQEIKLEGKSSQCSSTTLTTSTSSTKSTSTTTTSTKPSSSTSTTTRTSTNKVSEEPELEQANPITGNVIETGIATTLKIVPYLLLLVFILLLIHFIRTKNGKHKREN